jgi:hypothetical protein
LPGGETSQPRRPPSQRRSAGRQDGT